MPLSLCLLLSCDASGLYFVAMNYTVHAIMYFYYFLTALGYRPRWALAVTVFQLSQVRWWHCVYRDDRAST